MSNQLKEQQKDIDRKVAAVLNQINSTEDTVKTIRNWLRSDKIKIEELISNFDDVIAGDFRYEKEYQKIDAKRYYELIEAYRYTISLMEQAIIEA
jgi:hypothetical protein